MAEAEERFNPKTLYDLSISSFLSSEKASCHKFIGYQELQSMPANIIADVYQAMCVNFNYHSVLANEITNCSVFLRLLKVPSVRQKLINIFSVLMCSTHRGLSMNLSSRFILYTQHSFTTNCKTSPMKNSNHDMFITREECIRQIENGMRLGSFFSDCGWFKDSLKVLATIFSLLHTLKPNYQINMLKLDCLQRLLQAQVTYCCFYDAEKVQGRADEIIRTQGIEKIPHELLLTYYKTLSLFYFAKSDYSLSYEWGVKALRMIEPYTPDKLTIDVLRVAAKACVVKREFDKARILIQKAVNMALESYGDHHQKYADTLLDYGFFLSNVDEIAHAVHQYTRALEIKRVIHGFRNIAVATAEEDLSYALYVLEYSSGHFESARDHICKSIEILRSIVPRDHLLLSSARRVKALILEEIALDNVVFAEENSQIQFRHLLAEAEKLHQSALEITMDAFGEDNVQTAKHYGNLGRLYQSMEKYEEAEELHQRAIRIKTDLLGPYDYEVGLSIGHLASLYGYHMKKYREAEELYLKSIGISLRLFGEGYSGLEYDYKGLCNVYEHLNEPEKYLQYSNTLDTWRHIREANFEVPTRDDSNEDLPFEEIRQKFFELCGNDEEEEENVAVAENDAVAENVAVAENE